MEEGLIHHVRINSKDALQDASKLIGIDSTMTHAKIENEGTAKCSFNSRSRTRERVNPSARSE